MTLPETHGTTASQTLFVVCGFPGSGKSVVSRALSRLSGVACLRKDDLKACLSDHGVAVSRPIALFYDLARSILLDGASLILDACFNFDEDVDLLGELADVTAGPTVVLECMAPLEIRTARMRKRTRHPAHSVADQLSIEQAGQAAFDYRRLSGVRYAINTARPSEATHAELSQLLETVPIHWQLAPGFK